MVVNIKFAGIDDWNRAGYKVEGKKTYLGDVDHLWNWNATKEEVNAYYKEHLDSLCVFGSTFNKGDDPYGANIKEHIKLNII